MATAAVVASRAPGCDHTSRQVGSPTFNLFGRDDPNGYEDSGEVGAVRELDVGGSGPLAVAFVDDHFEPLDANDLLASSLRGLAP